MEGGGYALLIAGVAALGAAGLWVARDYRAWRALGIGGLPHTARGWLKMTRWRLMAGDVLSTAVIDRDVGAPGDCDNLADLPPRCGMRPRIAPHPVPHRQLDQHIPEGLRPLHQAVFDRHVAAGDASLHYARSHFERHNQAITLRCPDHGHPVACATCGEIAHIHPSDGSMHMILSPSDARHVIAGGWGERHGLAGKALGLPTTYLLIYAPQDADGLAMIDRILGASIRYMSS